MIDKLIACIKRHDEISDYEITSTHSEKAQLFFVLNKLETNRATDNTSVSATIYVKHDGYLGSASLVLNAADDDETIENKIKDAIKIAKTINNPCFELEKDKDSPQSELVSIQNRDLKDVAIKTAKAIIKADEDKEGWLNSIEVFVRRNSHHLVNSQGVDRRFEKTSLFAEIIPTWKGKDEEVELYLSFNMITEDYEAITQKARDILLEAKRRSEAVKPSGKMLKADVIIKGEMLDTIMANFKSDLHFSNVYMHSNHYSLNDEVVPYDLNMKVKGILPEAYYSAPFDSHGTLVKDTAIIENGKVSSYWGDIQYGQYLKADKISGNGQVVEVEVGKEATFEKLALPYLELCNFSSPQLESNSGYCGGEVRLALYHDLDGSITPLSSFSISTNIYEAIKEATFSKEMITSDDYHGPKYLRLKGVTIS